MTAGGFDTRVVATAVVATDGTGDFTDIQTAIDSLPSGGGVVYIKEGTYTLTTGLTVTTDNVAIVGAGKSTIINTTSNIPLISVTGDDFRIENVFFQGNDTGFTQVGIKLSSVASGLIEGCWVEDMGAQGIHISVLTDCIIINNIVSSNSWEGINIVNADRVIVKDNICTSNGRDGISVGGDNCIVVGNICRANTENGIELPGINLKNIINGNQLIDNGDFGIKITNASSDDTILVGNIIRGNTDGAISDNGLFTESGHNITS